MQSSITERCHKQSFCCYQTLHQHCFFRCVFVIFSVGIVQSSPLCIELYGLFNFGFGLTYIFKVRNVSVSIILLPWNRPYRDLLIWLWRSRLASCITISSPTALSTVQTLLQQCCPDPNGWPWPCPGPVLAMSWPYPGPVLALSWPYLGPIALYLHSNISVHNYREALPTVPSKYSFPLTYSMFYVTDWIQNGWHLFSHPSTHNTP